MKRYYSETIPTELGKKLEKFNMPIDWWCTSRGKEQCMTTYAEVFDWLTEKGVHIYIVKAATCDQWHYVTGNVIVQKSRSYTTYYPTWHEAANVGIKTVLKMLKEE